MVNVAQAITGNTSPTQSLATIQADPAKQLEFQLAMSKQENDIAMLLIQDVQSARSRDVELHKSGNQNYRADILAYLAISALIGILYLALFMNLQAGPGRDLILMLSGTLVAVVKDVYNFEFGSTRSSKGKDDTINKLSS